MTPIDWTPLAGPEACGTVKPAYVMSTSYSYNEADLTPAYEERQCAEYAKVSTAAEFTNEFLTHLCSSAYWA